MNAEDVIECRVLTGFHCLPFAQYTTPHTNRRCEHEAGMTMIGASIGGRPVGLAVFSCQNDSEKASLESIFVHPDARRRGVGRGLLQAVDSTLIERGVAGVTGTWYHDARSAAMVECLLADFGWSDPVPSSTVHRGGRRLLDHLVGNSRVTRLPAGFIFDSWADLSSDEIVQVRDLREVHEIGMGLHPDGETMLSVSSETTVVLRREGEIAGWMMHHELDRETLRYSSLWLRPDLAGRGLGISLGIESARRHLGLVERIPRLFFLVAEGNDAMHRLIARRLQPGIDRSSILMRSSKALIHASSDGQVEDTHRP